MGALNKYTLLGFLLIIASLGARADFTSGEYELEVECCESTGWLTYEFTNNWTETVEYELTAVGDGAEWVYVGDKKIKEDPVPFTLKPGEDKVLQIIFHPCCYAMPGEYVIGLQYSSEKGRKTQNVTLTVPECRTVTIEVTPEKNVVGQCEEAVFDVKLSNQSITDETIQLRVEGIAAEWLELSWPSEFLLEEGSERTVQLKVNAPCTASLREYNGRVIARIKGTEFSTSEEFVFETEDRQFVEIGTEEQWILQSCNDLEEEKTVSISNNGRAEDTLALSISGPEWIGLKEKALSLEAGETKDISLYFHSGDIDEKTYSFTLKASSEIYGKETEQEFSVLVKDCFKLGVEKIRGVEEACLEEGLSYEFLIKNVKEKDTSAELSVKGMKAAVSPASLELKTGEGEKAIVSFDLSGETAGEKEFTLMIDSESFSFSKAFGIRLNDCYAIELDSEELQGKIELTAGPQVCPGGKIITARVKNTGTMEQTVSIKFAGIEWVLVEPKELVLDAGESKEFYAYFSPPVNIGEGGYSGLLEVSAEDFHEKVAIRASVETLSAEQIDVSAESEFEEEIIETQKTIKARIKLRNTGSCLLGVNNIKAAGFDVSFDSTSFELDVNMERTVIATVFLGELEAEEISMPITIETNRGIIKKMLSISLAEEEVVVEEIGEEEEEEAETRTVTANISFRNTEESRLVVSSISAEGFQVSFEPAFFELDANEEQAIVATITVDKEAKGEISVPITIETDKGLIKKTITVSVGEEEEKKEGIPTGFIGLGDKTVNIIILLFLAIVAVVIVVLAWHAYKKPVTQKKKAK